MNSTTSPSTLPTALHRELAGQLSRLIHEDGLEPGARLNENRLAERLGVSRTPLRAALRLLAGQGYVEHRDRQGARLVARPPLARPAPATAADADDALLVRIARDRRLGRLADLVSEREMMAAYGLNRPAIRQLLERLADLGIVERRLGYGWRFLEEGWDTAAHDEGYRFRMVIEPAAIREPGFRLDPAWAEAMRERHRAFLVAPWSDASSIAFFEMNAAFHEGIAAASGNRFFLAAMRRQNRLRRLSNYDWTHGRGRVDVNCREHLEMLERLQAGDTELAALLMKRHLEVASRLPPASPDYVDFRS